MILPIAAFLTSVFFASIALHHDVHRLQFLPLIVIPVGISLINADGLLDLDDLWAIGLVVYLVHITSVLFFESWVLLRPAKKRYDFTAAYKIWSNPQLLNTPRQIPGAYRVDHPPSRTRFTVVRIARIVLYITLLQLSALYIFPGPFMPLTVEDFSPAKEVYFRRLLGLWASDIHNHHPVTRRETAIRALCALHWIWSSYLTLNAANDALALWFTVILRLDTPADWPRLFGRPREAYTLRRFWGRFWHRLVYRPYMNYAGWVARVILGLEAGGVAEKWCVVFGVFLLSGCTHAVVNWAVGIGIGGRDIWWYCMNFLAGALERAVVVQARRWLKGDCYPSMMKMVGFGWVFGFFFWSVPKREYAGAHSAIMSMS